MINLEKAIIKIIAGSTVSRDEIERRLEANAVVASKVAASSALRSLLIKKRIRELASGYYRVI